VKVTAPDGVTTQSYVITVTRAASSDDTLSSLVASTGALTPTFTSGHLLYTQNVANAVVAMTVTPTATQGSSATITVNTVPVVSGSTSTPITLNVGSNTITVKVTAPDGVTTQSYVITVTRAASSDATLSSLAVNQGSLSPSFSSSVTSYSDSTHTSPVKVTPTVNTAGATVTVNGVTVPSGFASGGISTHTITIIVTAPDGVTTKTYTITMTYY
jgi:hypothetical protein